MAIDTDQSRVTGKGTTEKENGLNEQQGEECDLSTRHERIGAMCAVGAHMMWGFFPLYWHLLDYVPSATLTAYRVIWSFLLLMTLSIAMPQLRRALLQLREPRKLAIYAATATMIGINWGAFMYAVGSGQVLQASLGYYINPLLNVLLGVVVLGERLKPFQWIAVGFAAIGVAVMVMMGSGMPWIALAMASAFAIYGLLKKKATLPPLEGLSIETGLLFPAALAFLLLQSPDPGAQPYSPVTWLLLIIGGALTIAPLALFATAAKRVTLTTIGILQYVGPTLQWFVGVVLLGEAFGGSKLIGFLFVWTGVTVFIVGGLQMQSRATRQARQVALAE
ncbi:EamA-like transporter family protein [Rosistilla oblonga]|nr:EamA-like transporter family protein [Rosistilla oblonga]